MSVEIFIEFTGKPGYSPGERLLPEDIKTTWLERLLTRFCIHNPTQRNDAKLGYECRCGKIFVPNEFIYIKPGYWREYY